MEGLNDGSMRRDKGRATQDGLGARKVDQQRTSRCAQMAETRCVQQRGKLGEPREAGDPKSTPSVIAMRIEMS